MRKRFLPNEMPNVFYANPFELCQSSASSQLYDKVWPCERGKADIDEITLEQVIIDAQCTLDASVRHILRYGKVGWKEFTPKTTEETANLQVTSTPFSLPFT